MPRCRRNKRTYRFLPRIFRASQVIEMKGLSKSLRGLWGNSRLAFVPAIPLHGMRLSNFSGFFRSPYRENPNMPRCICNESCYWKWAASRLVRICLNTKGLPKARENRGEKGNSKMPATPTMCMKIKGRISARWAYPTMLMKTRHLILLCHDVDDKKSVGQSAEVKSKATKRTRGARQRKGRFRPAPPEFRWSLSKDMPAPNGQKRPSRFEFHRNPRWAGRPRRDRLGHSHSEAMSAPPAWMTTDKTRTAQPAVRANG